MKISGLTAEQAQAVDEAIALAADYLATDPPFSPVEVQRLYDAVAKDHPDRLEAQIAVGMAFGEMIISKAGYEWVRASDEYGEETALCHRTAAVTCFPISMLQKRIAKREAVDLVELRDATIAVVEEAVIKGNWQPRQSDSSRATGSQPAVMSAKLAGGLGCALMVAAFAIFWWYIAGSSAGG